LQELNFFFYDSFKKKKRKLEKEKGKRALKPIPGSQAPFCNNTNSLRQQQ
jgi:hypothetical protein